MHPTNYASRVAGALYLLSSLPAIFSFQYVPATLIVSGNATATANKVLASEMLFRVSIVCELIAAVTFILAVGALYRLLNGVNKTHASLMVILFLVSVPISFLNVLNETAALALFHGAGFLSVFEKQRLDALAMLFLGLHSHGVGLAAIFWGLWLVPFGILVMRSGFLPRILGVLLIAACFGYLADSLTSLLLPGYGNLVNRFAPILEGVGELPIMAWLLIKGARVQPSAAVAS